MRRWLGLLVVGSTINMFSLIGFIMLLGLVTNNGILLVDFANKERERGLSLDDALINAGAIRFRPIVMTTLAMIVGMIPLALAVGRGGAQRAPMAHAEIGGLITSVVLTLIVVPVIISYIDGYSRRAAKLLPTASEDHGGESFSPGIGLIDSKIKRSGSDDQILYMYSYGASPFSHFSLRA